MNNREKARRKAVKTPRALRARRCKDCRWAIKKWGRCRICQHPSYSYETKKMTGWCLGYGMNALAHKLYGCANYTRKRWKFWRSK